jgi:four helix bundle protein
MSYKNLKVWQIAREVSIDIHKMTFDLPKHEMYETGSQIRRSSKSVRSNIVEGYGRRKYQQEYYRFLTFAISSNDETTDHLETLFETGSLKNKDEYDRIHSKLDTLGRKLNLFLQSFD